jgi:regulator of sigma E protease
MLLILKLKDVDEEYLLKIKPNIVLSDDNLGNKINKRMVGIKLGAYNNEINHVKLGPAQALIHSIKEVYFVSASSFKYIGTMIKGTGDSSQLGGPIRIAKLLDKLLKLVSYLSFLLWLIFQ